ncbi:tRNA (cytidine(34)-2'-O)-methyltransferase [Sphingomonas psychrotolerans]|uniref:tRNA (cytidine(34)-2'-O)-methyltransferase n=1 Tax=Sphingomonas psychrotolerans TaxID=1327635 RepID=A0ABU3N7R0_9SPHN|nr:tRNA (cytidine(34)-2'-O)-methyltransferase [Sphingomonas psychrotolerans]MDT8759526.1 tRNA (cytidine(34)-2'-O)-methyltransferase [Sphingomonas psychrotolerans]
MRIALFQPEIAGNVGAVLRLGACFGVPIDIIEPMGFPWSDKARKRSAMDYDDKVEVTRHADFDAFKACAPGRVLLFTTRGGTRLPDAVFQRGDTLLFGSESAGAPDFVHAGVDFAVRIPLAAGLRSLNLSVSAGIAIAEALRQTGGWPT